MPEAGSCLCLPPPGSPGPCAAHPSWGAELWEGAASGSPAPGGPGAHPSLRAAAISGMYWGAAGPGNPWSCPGQGGLGVAPASGGGGVAVPSTAPTGRSAVVRPAKHGGGEVCGLWSGGPLGPVAATCRLVFPLRLCQAGRGPGSLGVLRRAALAAGSGSVPPCPLQVPPGSVIQEARAVQEEPPAPGGRRGGQETTPLIHALLGSACVTHPPAAQGELRRLPLGAVGGRGAATPSPPRCRGEAAGDAVPWPSGTGSSWKGSPRFLPPGTLGGCPRFPGSRAHGPGTAAPERAAGVGSCSLSSSFPWFLCLIAEHWGTAGGGGTTGMGTHPA